MAALLLSVRTDHPWNATVDGATIGNAGTAFGIGNLFTG